MSNVPPGQEVWPYGKHKGEYIQDLDTDYIEWALENMELPVFLEKELQNQLTLRRGEGVVRK